MNNQINNTTPVDEAAIRELAGKVMTQVSGLLDSAGKIMNAEQLHKLDLHMVAMARRSLTGEGLPDFDKSLFDEISEASIKLSRSVVDLFRNLPDEEALLLSIHFEMAQNKS